MKTHVTINGQQFELFKPVFAGGDNYLMDKRDEVLNILLLALDGLSFEKIEKQNCIECGELVGEHEIIKNCHGSCRIEI